jgi:hypothetical protein
MITYLSPFSYCPISSLWPDSLSINGKAVTCEQYMNGDKEQFPPEADPPLAETFNDLQLTL